MRAWPEAKRGELQASHVRSRKPESARKGPSTVQIVLEGGEELQGKLLVPPGRALSDVLNSTAPFVEFEPAEGERMYIAKSALQSVKPTNVPAKPDLWAGSAEPSNFDPFAVLGLKAGATREEAREAYVRMAKIYHPDLYMAVELPREVRDYLAGDGAADQCRPPGARERAAKAGRQAGGGVHPQRRRVSGSSAHALLT